MAIHIPTLAWEPKAAEYLTHCFRYVSRHWQHAVRVPELPDQGFEQRFREYCVAQLAGWQISGTREMRLGSERETASGVLHEIDLTAEHEMTTGIAELKNYQGSPDKNAVIVFHAKVLDFLSANGELALRDLCLTFMTSLILEDPPLAACMGLGIHPISPQLRPVPVLVRNALYWSRKIDEGFWISDRDRSKFEDYCARLNRLMVALEPTWPSARYGFRAPDTLIVRAAPFPESYEAAGELRQANAECSELIGLFNTSQGSIEQ